MESGDLRRRPEEEAAVSTSFAEGGVGGEELGIELARVASDVKVVRQPCIHCCIGLD